MDAAGAVIEDLVEVLVAFIGGAVSFVLWTAIAVVIAAASAELVRRWTRSAWTPRHLLALAFGVMLSATLFGLFLVLADGRPENTILQLVLLGALPAAYQVLKRRYTPPTPSARGRGFSASRRTRASGGMTRTCGARLSTTVMKLSTDLLQPGRANRRAEEFSQLAERPSPGWATPRGSGLAEAPP
jgi:hypothetical protein